MSPETIVSGLAFPECPRWHDGFLYFSDMHDGIVWRIEPGGATKVVDVPNCPAGLGWLSDGTMQIVSMTDRKLLRLTKSGLTVAAEMSALMPQNANDMVISADDRAYIGNFGFDLNHGERMKPTVLVAVDRAGKMSVAADEMLFPNGPAITPDGKTLLVAETWGARITAFDIQPDGSLSGRRVYAPLPDDVYPDGICLDAEGGVWVSCAALPKIIRVAPGGAITHDISLPGRNSYACMLGGADRRDLYICTAEDHLPDKTVKLRSGRIEKIRVDIPGAGLP